MTDNMEYRGFLLEAATRQRGKASAWTLEVRITPVGRQTGVRRCRAPNTYPSQEAAVPRCLAFGRLIVDGKIQKIDRKK